LGTLLSPFVWSPFFPTSGLIRHRFSFRKRTITSSIQTTDALLVTTLGNKTSEELLMYPVVTYGTEYIYEAVPC